MPRKFLFDFPHILQSAMGEGRGYDDKAVVRDKNIESFQVTIENLMESVEHNKYHKDVIFHYFENNVETNIAAEIRARIYEDEESHITESDSEDDEDED